MNVLKVFVFLLGWMVMGLSLAQPSPVPMLEKTANEIITVLKANQGQLKSNPSIIYRTVETHLLPIVDVQGMSRSVLGRQAWTKATPAEREQFSKAFTQLVIRTYSSPLAQYTDETIQFLPLRVSAQSQFIRVNSVITRSAGQNIPLSYSLIYQNGSWKIYDFSVEGISLLQSFKSQFAQILQHASISEVIKQMQNNTIKKT